MGYNTTVVVLNDALSDIRDDPKFGEKLYRAIVELRHGEPAWVSAGCHCNAAAVIESHHADGIVTVAVGRNTGTVVEPKP